MTGEITLRGKVMPVGGIKEKMLAARRAGITEVILPRKNEPDLEDIPAQLRSELTYHFVDTVDQALRLTLEDEPRFPPFKPQSMEGSPAVVKNGVGTTDAVIR